MDGIKQEQLNNVEVQETRRISNEYVEFESKQVKMNRKKILLTINKVLINILMIK